MEITAAEYAEIQALRAEVAELRATVEAMRDRDPTSNPSREADSTSEVDRAGMNRRSMLRCLGGAGTGAALGAFIASGLMSPAGAATGDVAKIGQRNESTTPTEFVSTNTGPLLGEAFSFGAAGVIGISQKGYGLLGSSNADAGVLGVCGEQTPATGFAKLAGVWGDSAPNPGVAGTSRDAEGVSGASTKGTGVRGVGGINGVSGYSGDVHGFGVDGTCLGNVGVRGQGGVAGVQGNSATAQGVGVSGTGQFNVGVRGSGKTGIEGTSTDSSGLGVSGLSNSNIGVQGYGAKIGVNGLTFTGIGGNFAGGQAAIRLVPRSSAGKPTSGTHERGELIVDSAGNLFICTANGTPGTWKKVSATAA